MALMVLLNWVTLGAQKKSACCILFGIFVVVVAATAAGVEVAQQGEVASVAGVVVVAVAAAFTAFTSFIIRVEPFGRTPSLCHCKEISSLMLDLG